MPSRREFLVSSAALAAVTCGGVKEKAPRIALPFPLKRVRLLESPWLEAAQANARYLHALDADRLLHTFRLNAGLPSRAEPLGGWEKPDCELRGHFTGHYLSACALTHAAAGDEELKRKAGYLVSELAKCQRALGNGYLSAFPDEFFARLKAARRVWAPWYTLHKIMAGLLDVSALCGNGQALAVVQGMAGWAIRWARSLSDAEMARSLDVEHGGVMESFLELYARTGKAEYLDAATRFEHHRVLDPLAAGRDELTGLHANTNIPKIVGAARRYEITGEPRYRDIADFFWTQVATARSYVTGGNSNREHWRTPPGTLAGELGPETEECCCTYNMLKLTRHVFGWSADPRCGDFYERALFNGILGTLNPENGMTMYFLPLASGYWKLFSRPVDSFWCCTGTGMESFSKLADSIYFQDEGGLRVNLFIASELDWPEKGVRLRQTTGFPRTPATAFEFQARQPVDLALRIRIPAWVGGKLRIRINGKQADPDGQTKGYATLNRQWSPGDRVEVDLPMSLRSEPLLGDPGLQAFLYGPLVLAGRLGTEGLTAEMAQGGPGSAYESHTVQGKPVPAPEFAANPANLSSWIEPAPGQPLTFRTVGQKRNVTLVPLNQLFGERYGVYWRVRG